jgi:hypothetical protein
MTHEAWRVSCTVHCKGMAVTRPDHDLNPQRLFSDSRLLPNRATTATPDVPQPPHQTCHNRHTRRVCCAHTRAHTLALLSSNPIRPPDTRLGPRVLCAPAQPRRGRRRPMGPIRSTRVAAAPVRSCYSCKHAQSCSACYDSDDCKHAPIRQLPQAPLAAPLIASCRHAGLSDPGRRRPRTHRYGGLKRGPGSIPLRGGGRRERGQQPPECRRDQSPPPSALPPPPDPGMCPPAAAAAAAAALKLGG